MLLVWLEVMVCVIVCSDSGFMVLILVLGALLAVPTPGAMQGPGHGALAGLEVPGVPCARCSGSWV